LAYITGSCFSFIYDFRQGCLNYEPLKKAHNTGFNKDSPGIQVFPGLFPEWILETREVIVCELSLSLLAE